MCLASSGAAYAIHVTLRLKAVAWTYRNSRQFSSLYQLLWPQLCLWGRPKTHLATLPSSIYFGGGYRGFQMEQNNGTTISYWESVIRHEIADIEQNNVFSAAIVHYIALGSLVARLQKSFYYRNTPLKENACFGDNADLCEVCSKIPITRQASTWQTYPTRPAAGSGGIALARSVSLGNLCVVMACNKCAMCRIVTSVLLKDDSIIPSRNSATLECVLSPAEGAFRTYLDYTYVADVFYSSHAGSPLRGHISWQHYRHIPLTTWTVKQPEGESSSARIMWAQAWCRSIPHQNSSNRCPDFDQINGWLEKCQKGHNNTCNPKWSESACQAGIMIRLVDVDEKRLVPNCLSTEYSYVALSYVWGNHHQKPRTKDAPWWFRGGVRHSPSRCQGRLFCFQEAR
ncbi:hypothetical protein DL768_007248 [Monosporascus sp. mg162]|nr:hypothetical protein DL768_007248 [Monosporascus sp. mg162]